jgi:squalene-associated FAD-dependent desaturase
MKGATAPVRRRVAVVGGGLAGITAAVRCLDAGCDVTLHELRPRLGGLTYSFRRRVVSSDEASAPAAADSMWVDNGQHVFLRCCTAYQRLLDRLGVSDLVTLQPRLDVPVRSGDAPGRTAHLRRGRLPAPLHLAGSLLRYPWLTPAERLSFARAATALRSVDAEALENDRTSFGDWLRAHGQSDTAIAALWDLVGVAALNAHADESSLALGATVFQHGLLGEAGGGDIGWSTVPLQQLHGEPALRALERAGGHVRLRSKVGAVVREGDHLLVVTPSGVEPADAVIVAVPPPAVDSILPDGALPLPRGWPLSLGSAAIVNLHLLLDGAVLDEPFLAGLTRWPDGRTDYLWVFDRTSQSGLGVAPHQYLAVSVSAADDLVDQTTALLSQRFLPQLRRLLPRLPDVRLLDFFVTRERDATFRPAPGSAGLRPGPVTSSPGLFVAGAWTATGWPATMEGAVRSGEAAAAALLSSASTAALPGQVMA